MEYRILKKELIEQPRLIYTSLAYSKMLDLMSSNHASTKEFQFMGTVKKENNDYIIEDILLVPNEKCSATYCETDDAKYPEWLNKTFPEAKDRKKLRLHGHSHVNMQTNPSGTDEQQIMKLIDMVDDYFIQLIINHKQENTVNIYNKEQNLIYTNVIQYLLIGNIMLNLNTKTIINLNKLLNTKCSINKKSNQIYFESGLTLDMTETPAYRVEDNNLIFSNNRVFQITPTNKAKINKLFEKMIKDNKYTHYYAKYNNYGLFDDEELSNYGFK